MSCAPNNGGLRFANPPYDQCLPSLAAEQLVSTNFRLDNYLERIGYRGAIQPDLPTLAAINAAHVNSIPFEVFDPLLRRPVNLDLVALQEKLVDNRRGGYCFEQNALFKAALDAVGFQTTGLGARVRFMVPPDSPLGPRTHMLIRVDLPEGPYLADVGFGGCLLDAPLQLKADLEQRTAMGMYRLTQSEGLFLLSSRQPAGWRDIYAFNLEPQLPSDYEISNWYTSTHPGFLFANMLLLERLSHDKRYLLVNRRFMIEARDGEVTSERLLASAAELGQVLDETFNVKPPAPVEEIFARVGG